MNYGVVSHYPYLDMPVPWDHARSPCSIEGGTHIHFILSPCSALLALRFLNEPQELLEAGLCRIKRRFYKPNLANPLYVKASAAILV